MGILNSKADRLRKRFSDSSVIEIWNSALEEAVMVANRHSKIKGKYHEEKAMSYIAATIAKEIQEEQVTRYE